MALKENKRVAKLYQQVQELASELEFHPLDSADAILDATDPLRDAEIVDMVEYGMKHPNLVMINDSEYTLFWDSEEKALAKLEKMKSKAEKQGKAE